MWAALRGVSRRFRSAPVQRLVVRPAGAVHRRALPIPLTLQRANRLASTIASAVAPGITTMNASAAGKGNAV